MRDSSFTRHDVLRALKSLDDAFFTMSTQIELRPLTSIYIFPIWLVAFTVGFLLRQSLKIKFLWS